MTARTRGLGDESATRGGAICGAVGAGVVAAPRHGGSVTTTTEVLSEPHRILTELYEASEEVAHEEGEGGCAAAE